MPSHLLTEEEMIDIMTDVQIIEADINRHKAKGDKIGNMPEVYYSQLFEHYGITDSIFAENLRYYTYNPATTERIMDSVTERIIRQAESIGQDSE